MEKDCDLARSIYNWSMKSAGRNRLIWLARVLIAAVTVMNVQAALQFMFAPQNFAAGFEMSGVVGEAMMRGMGVLFLMWSVPYVFASIQPVRYQIALVSAVIMHFIGVAGESLILATIPETHAMVHASVTRFILFDGGGLIVLLCALFLVSLTTRPHVKNSEH